MSFKHSPSQEKIIAKRSRRRQKTEETKKQNSTKDTAINGRISKLFSSLSDTFSIKII
jgi:hypothetical protein